MSRQTKIQKIQEQEEKANAENNFLHRFIKAAKVRICTEAGSTTLYLRGDFSNPPPLMLRPTFQVDREEFPLSSEPKTSSSFPSWNKLDGSEVIVH
ncbi:hypothetical protein RvY_18302 [Ramazzottius varieornatus]|uniref:Uncharacterized protein n=1 Tax=Ramazzottius varieornatus TaxID=947166 RepID=A0A1D1WAZ7_RAMVA|nr:hypothetical protein RvY_18302 [Ramazzottius varieornatus]